MSSYYDNLGLSQSASADEIRSAYRALAKKYHPDQNRGNADAERKIKEVNEAYDVLKDPEKKALYDRVGHDRFVGGGGGGSSQQHEENFDFSGFSGVFDELFGGGRRQRRQPKGEDLRADVQLSLEEVFEGKAVELNVPSYETCTPCHGSGAAAGSTRKQCGACRGTGQARVSQGFFTVQTTCRTCGGAGNVIEKPCESCRGEGRIHREKKYKLDIPAGVEDGTRLRLPGKGAAGRRGEQTGDLYVFVTVTPHPLFEREGDNLYCLVPIPPHRAVLGGDVDIPTIEGMKTRFNLPAGTQHAQRYKLAGKGMTRYNKSTRGNLIVQIEVEVPSRLSSTQERLYREIEASYEKLNAKHRPKEADFVSRMRQFLSGFGK
ncbi:MAG: molecular chaperone DnaJ [Alphaproteobacteria bacterium]|nr:molecular chaperone DnaJ [Alphaproteobacteria bacterium]